MLSKIEAALQRVSKFAAIYVSGCGILLAMVILVLDASMRTFLRQPILFVLDAVMILLVWTVFAAFAYALNTGAHVRMTLVVDRLPARLQSVCAILGNLIGVVFFAVLTPLAAEYAWKSFLLRESIASVIPVPLWISKLALPIGTCLILVMFLVRLIRSLHPKHEVIKEYKVPKF